MSYIIDKTFYNDGKSDVREWITVKGVHVPIKDGETKEQAVKNFIDKKDKNQESLGSRLKGKLTKKISAQDAHSFISRFGSTGGGSGYSEGESVNAAVARSKGLATAKDIARALKDEGFDISDTDIDDLLSVEEWHHTGKNFDRTNFYDVSDIDEEDVKKLSDLNKKAKKDKKESKKLTSDLDKLSIEDLFDAYIKETGEGGTLDTIKMMFGNKKRDMRRYMTGMIRQKRSENV